ncbi:hypothetical protein [Lysinibacillus parviboronicapiens]|nr:hypothetical protein [Lysinibacillus parviboronicapiens]
MKKIQLLKYMTNQKDSYAGNFILGCHPDGREITNIEDYAFANRVAT